MENIREIIVKELKKLSLEAEAADLEHPKNLEHGDFSFFAADPNVDVSKISHPYIEKVEVLGKFINFRLSKKFFSDSLAEILKDPENFGKSKTRDGEKVIFEYTDPNLFKEFHIGHLMSNTVGEALSRISEASGSVVKRACYQSDIGLNVAKSIWAIKKLAAEKPALGSTLKEKITFLGKTYVHGSKAYDDYEKAKKEIEDLNKKIYDKSDDEINQLYDWGRKVSLEHFEEIFEILGTRFDQYFFESEAAPVGMFLIEEFLKKGIFKKSEGAVVFPGEEYGLHTRVFVNSQGLPTYETKELGLAKLKSDRETFDRSIVITANEQTDYFKVVLKALEFIDSTTANKTRHVAHGMLRFAEGKMSSRTGNIITGESLILKVEDLVREKIKDREFDPETATEVAEVVAIGAIKYSILKQSPGKDIIFDFDKSLSFEGDSGPYLQYSYARSKSVLAKAKEEGIKGLPENTEKEVTDVEKLIYRFPEIVERAEKEFAPNLIATYLIELASSFNSFYAKERIADPKDKNAPYKVALTEAFATTVRNGLYLLGIRTLEKM